MGPRGMARRRGRRRGLVVGAAVGAGVARHNAKQEADAAEPTEEYAETPQADAPAPAGGDMYDQLEKLGRLKADGILTESEFQAQKEAILNQ